MRFAPISVGSDGLEYVSASLRLGLSLAQLISVDIWNGRAYAFVPVEIDAKRIQNFSHGGIGEGGVDAIISYLRSSYRDSYLILELPLWGPADVEALGGNRHLMRFGQNVYMMASLKAPSIEVSEVVRSSDPSFMYNAFIVNGTTLFDEFESYEEWLQGQRREIQLVVAGAYDGEGFVLVEMR